MRTAVALVFSATSAYHEKSRRSPAPRCAVSPRGPPLAPDAPTAPAGVLPTGASPLCGRRPRRGPRRPRGGPRPIHVAAGRGLPTSLASAVADPASRAARGRLRRASPPPLMTPSSPPIPSAATSPSPFAPLISLLLFLHLVLLLSLFLRLLCPLGLQPRVSDRTPNSPTNLPLLLTRAAVGRACYLPPCSGAPFMHPWRPPGRWVVHHPAIHGFIHYSGRGDQPPITTSAITPTAAAAATAATATANTALRRVTRQREATRGRRSPRPTRSAAPLTNYNYLP